MERSPTVQRAMEGFVRLGYVAKAVVYILIGVLALEVALGVGGRITDPAGSLYVLLRQPWGHALVLSLAIGLLTYAAWQIAAALFGWRRHAREGAISRALTVVRAAVYGAVGVQALRLALGLRKGESGPEPLVRAAMEWPMGEWLVLAAGVGAVIYGIFEIRDAIRERLEPDLDASTLRRNAGEWALHTARAGITARALVLVLLGASVVRAALGHRPSTAGGIDSSLLVLHSLPSGGLMLGLAAAGLFAYGIYQLFHARWAQL